MLVCLAPITFLTAVTKCQRRSILKKERLILAYGLKGCLGSGMVAGMAGLLVTLHPLSGSWEWTGNDAELQNFRACF